ncbi:hypothetical protein HK097_007356 [Rhizophlyctis rosea]|uniref:non-specific serine/threonine protein kinase n=1 Tax=Rhizophlyctis rosea TaxID=64517 RepID=A0AAD5SD97_9FUNG|nr:hypothetical protein HK097_007356 [Rhizophlyctis rosea]
MEPWTVETPKTEPAKGRLYIKVVEARNLLVKSPNSRPYCVVEFEKNEFVTKEAISNSANGHAQNGHGYGGQGNGYGNGQDAGFSPVWRHEATFDVSRPDGEVTISIWDRSVQNPGEGEPFLGMMKIRPPRINGKVHDNWFRLLPRQWREKVKGEIRIQLMYKTVEAKALSASDFELMKVVGKGSFGKVLQVRKKDTGRIYAMKVLVKKDIVERQEVAHTLSERNVLIQATSPFLVGLKFSFQTPEKLYLVLDYCNGGELFYHLQKETAFSEERAKFYTCELILALEHLHKYNVIYRDLKPENILLDSSGHIALTDFGLCKENVTFDDTTNTFCGTAEYLAPEVLTGQGYGKAVDWWSLGILFYEMTTGLPPFYSENTNLMYKKILHNQLLFPPGFSEKAQIVVRGLLERDPKKRLGGGPDDGAAIKRQAFFADVDWDKLLKKEISPPFKPKVESETDTSNFDPIFTAALPVDSLPHDAETPLSETLQQNFKGFTYTDDSAHLTEISVKKPSGLRSTLSVDEALEEEDEEDDDEAVESLVSGVSRTQQQPQQQQQDKQQQQTRQEVQRDGAAGGWESKNDRKKESWDEVEIDKRLSRHGDDLSGFEMYGNGYRTHDGRDGRGYGEDSGYAASNGSGGRGQDFQQTYQQQQQLRSAQSSAAMSQKSAAEPWDLDRLPEARRLPDAPSIHSTGSGSRPQHHTPPRGPTTTSRAASPPPRKSHEHMRQPSAAVSQKSVENLRQGGYIPQDWHQLQPSYQNHYPSPQSPHHHHQHQPTQK